MEEAQGTATSAYVRLFLDVRLRTILICILLASAMMSAIAPYVSLVGVTALGLSPVAFSVILVASSGVTVGIAVLAGALSDVVRNRLVVALGLCLIGAIGYAAVFVFRNATAFALATVLLIPFSAAVYSQLFALLRSVPQSSADRDATTSIVRALFALPWIVVPPAAAAFLIWFPGETNIYGISALFAVLCALILLTLFGRLPPGAGGEGAGRRFLDGLARLRSPALAGRVLILGLIYGAHKLHSSIMALIVVQNIGGSIGEVGRVAGLTALLEVPMILLWGWLVPRLGKSTAVALGGLAFGAYLGGLWLVSDISQVYVLTPISACGSAAILSVILVYVQEMLPDNPGLGTSLMTVTSFLGSAFSGLVFGIWGRDGAYQDLALVGALMAVAGAVAIGLIDRRRSQG